MKRTIEQNERKIMQLKKLFILSAAALLSATPPKSTAANSWTTVLDYQFDAGYSSVSLCITAGGALDPGDVFAGGWGYPGITSLSGYVLKTTDLDETQTGWTQIDDSNTDPQDGYQTTVHGLRFDSTGGYLYEIGSLSDPCTQGSCPGSCYWYIRRSTDFGASWAPDLQWQYAPGTTNSFAERLTADHSGNIFVVGMAQDSTGLNRWVVLKGVPSPTYTSWTTVDDFGTSGGRASGIGVVPGVAGGPDSVFAVGHTRTITKEKHGSITNYSWVVRRSTEEGAPGTWVTVDQFELPTGYSNPNPYGVGADIYGNIYVAGDTTVPLGKHQTPTSQWLVRMSPAGANAGNAGTWTTVDAFSYVPGGASAAYALGHDSVGNVVVVGTAAADLAGSEWLWLVRSPNQGVWQTLDAYAYPDPSSHQSIPWDVVADGARNLLVSGGAYFGTGPSHWIVRRFGPPQP